MTTKSTDEERKKFDHVEHGSMGEMNEEAYRQHFQGVRNAAIARAKRESAGHQDCRCWACLYVARLEQA